MLEELKEKIISAIESGEILSAIYYGGSQPGTFRQFFPIKVVDNGVFFREVPGFALKKFFFEKMELVDPETTQAEPYKIQENPVEFPGDADGGMDGGYEDVSIEASSREDRSDILIAHFVDGYAVGWRFAVPDDFKASLDIRLTTRIIKERTYWAWTQGVNFSFEKGDVFYSDRMGYDDFSSALRLDDFVCIQVIKRASGNGKFKIKEVYSMQAEHSDIPLFFLYAKGKKTIKKPANSFTVSIMGKNNSLMEFAILKPNDEKTALKEIKRFECRPDRFVALLQSGILFAHQSPPVSVFAVGSEDEKNPPFISVVSDRRQ